MNPKPSDDRELSGRARERLERLQAATARLRVLLDGELREREQEDRAGLAGAPLNIGTLVCEAAGRATDFAERRGVHVEVDCEGGALCGDGSLLGEALSNLLANAIEASPRGSTVSVVTRLTGEGHHVWEVRDAGHGIPADRLLRLGQRFCTSKTEGTGLGLALVQDAVSRHGGVLCVASSVERGTTFNVWLPATRAQPTDPAAPELGT